jgi:hypothetical protein
MSDMKAKRQDRIEYKKRTEFAGLFNSKKGKSSWEKIDDLKKWYDGETLSGAKCKYCGLTEEEQFKLFNNDNLRSKRLFPSLAKSNRKMGRGKFLEIDRKNPNNDYSSENCNLCCYFCNNDKSDIFTDKQYVEFAAPQKRAEWLRKLLKENQE